MKTICLTAALLFSFNLLHAQLDGLDSYPKTCETEKFKSKNGMKEYVEVDFMCSLSTPLDAEMMKKITWSAMPAAKYKCSNPPTFIPTSFTLMEMDGELSAVVHCTAENAYGVRDDVTVYFKVDKEGNVTAL